MNDLKSVCLASIKDLRKLGKFEKTYNQSGYTFIDNGADILAVAHIDTVSRGKPNFTSVAGTHVSIQLDDRLGVYILLNVLPALGMKYDILLTEDEEIGCSTAYDFVTDKHYNWIFEVDRRGVGECALYQYYNAKNCDIARDAGFKPVMGSFTDICYLDRLGVSAFNFSAGYIGEHFNTCYTTDVNIWVVSQMIFEFYTMYKDTVIPYAPAPVVKPKKVVKSKTIDPGVDWDAYVDADDDKWSKQWYYKDDNDADVDYKYSDRFIYRDDHQCDFCGSNDGLDYGITYILCPNCYNNIWQGQGY